MRSSAQVLTISPNAHIIGSGSNMVEKMERNNGDWLMGFPHQLFWILEMSLTLTWENASSVRINVVTIKPETLFRCVIDSSGHFRVTYMKEYRQREYEVSGEDN